MQSFILWIPFLLTNLSVCNYTITTVQAASASLFIYISKSDSSQDNCNLISLNDTLCDINITNFTSYTCHDLDNALNHINTTSDNFSFAHICLSSGDFTLRQSWSLNISVVLTGHSADNWYPTSVIQCQYSDKQSSGIASTADQLKYALFFHNVQFVKLEYVQFESCPQPLRIELSYNVSILNCVFVNFSEAALDIYNSAHVTIANSNFSNNSGTGNVLLPFRGNTGAVAIGYNKDESFIFIPNPNILVQNCLFVNNQANVFTESILTSSMIVTQGAFTGRGGGLGLLINESFHNVTALITNCRFHNNLAFSFGGAFYVAFNGTGTQHRVTVNNCQFVNNAGILGAGAICIGYLTNGNFKFPMTAVIQNSLFAENKGETGGAIFIFPASAFGGEGNVAFIQNSIFKKNEATNFGGAIAAATYSPFKARELQPFYCISNSTFKQNRCPDGIVNIGYIPFILSGKNVFISNRGPALRVIGSLVQIQDEIDFIENEAQDGGALYINSFGQLRIYPNTTMLFERNKGQVGASIVVITEQFSSVYNKLIYNPQCFIIHGISDKTPLSDVNDFHFTFIDNSALEATAIFIRSTVHCSWNSNSPPYFDAGSILNWSFLDISWNDTKNISHIETVVTDIQFTNKTVSGWPGQQLSVPIELTDEANQLASEFIQLESVDGNNKPTSRYKVQPTLLYQQRSELSIQFAVEDDVEADINSNTANSTIVVREFSIGSTTSRFTVNVIPCLIGYELTYDSEFGGLTCQCHDDLDFIRNCEDDQRTILLTDGLWGLAQPHNGQHNNLVVYPCPPGYCRCLHNHSGFGDGICSFAYFNGEPDRQCNCGRQGYLCGDCKDGKGVSALMNRCVNCSDVNGILIAVLIILDTVFISALVYKNVKFTALLFPVIFFVNMISYVGENFPTSYDHVGKYIYFINSLLSLYFPYDFCLYSGATPLATYTFRYFPIFLTIIIFSISILCYEFHFKKIKSFSSYSLWLLVTLQYSHVIYTSMMILNCPQVVNENGEHESRWFVKGSLNCFTGHHILLGLLAIFMLLICALLIPFLGLAAIGKLKKPHWIGQMAKCITCSFREELPWWCVVELIRKFLFLLFLIPFPQNTFPPMFILMVTFTIYAYMLPYKDMLVNIIELSFQLCFLIFLLLRSTWSIIGDYLVFPDAQVSASYETDGCSNEIGTANLTWLLFPFAYFPLIVITVIFSIQGTLIIRQRLTWCKPKVVRDDSKKQSPTVVSTVHVDVSQAQQFTVDCVDGSFVLMKRQNTVTTDINKPEVNTTTED